MPEPPKSAVGLLDRMEHAPDAAVAGPHMRARDRLTAIALFSVSLIAMFASLGAFPLMNPSEGFYAEGAREMLESGNYLVPHLNYAPWHEKPAIIFWAIAASFKLFGVNEFASRVPSALSAALVIPMIFMAARAFVPYRAALLSGLVMLSSALFLVVGRLALTDMLLSLFVSASILSFLIALARDKTQFLWLGYVACALSLMTKGPLALIIIGGSLFGYLVVMHIRVHHIWHQIKRLKIIPGFLILALIAAPWYVAIHLATAGAFSEEFFLAQNLARLVGHQRISLHAEPSWFYAPVYFGGLFPWSVVLLACLAMTRKRFISRVESARKIEIMALCWLISTSAAISAASGKLPTYVVPSLPAFALLMGINLDRLCRLRNPRLTGWIVAASGILTIIGIPIFCSHLGITKIGASELLVVAAIVILSMGQLGFALTVLLGRKSRNAVYSLALGTAIAIPILVPLSMQIHYSHFQNDLKEAIDHAATHRSAAVVSLYRPVPIAQFYLKREVPVIMIPEQLEVLARKNRGKRIFLLSQTAYGDALNDQYTYYEAIEGRRWILYGVKWKQKPIAEKPIARTISLDSI